MTRICEQERKREGGDEGVRGKGNEVREEVV